jgi:hypothetical protein
MNWIGELNQRFVYIDMESSSKRGIDYLFFHEELSFSWESNKILDIVFFFIYCRWYLKFASIEFPFIFFLTYEFFWQLFIW